MAVAGRAGPGHPGRGGLLPDAVVVTVPAPDARRPRGRPRARRTRRRGVRRRAIPCTACATSRGELPAEVQQVVDHDRPPPDQQGLVVFFTGLSGSGKSTLARALVDLVLEQGERTVTSLDGDVVRRNLSAGLTFSKEDRETNIRRIGWVAAEISRHGGVAVVSPIAPFDETRQQVRAMVADAGGAFFLVHVATPLEECERRDRKGLYAKARAGEIPEFTGISSPYEEPRGRRRPGRHHRPDHRGRPRRRAGRAARRRVRRPPGEGPLRLHRQHLPLAVGRGAGAGARGSPDVEFSSAGTHAQDGEPINPEMVAVLPPELDTSGFRSRRLTTARSRTPTWWSRWRPRTARSCSTTTRRCSARSSRSASSPGRSSGRPQGLDRDGLLAQRGHHAPERRSRTRRARPLSSGARGRLRVRGAPRRAAAHRAACSVPLTRPRTEDDLSAWTC